MNQNCSSCPRTVLGVEKFFLYILLVVNNLHITAIINHWKINQSCTQRNSFQCTFLNLRLEVLCTSVQHGSKCSLWWTVMGSFKFSRILRIWMPRLWKSCYFGSWQKQSQVWKSSIKASKNVATSTIVVSLDLFSPTPSSCSAMKTDDPQSPGPSSSRVEIEETPEWIERNPNAPKPTAE